MEQLPFDGNGNFIPEQNAEGTEQVVSKYGGEEKAPSYSLVFSIMRQGHQLRVRVAIV